MLKIGIIGGVSWESTAIYYKLINQAISIQLGGLSSAQMIIRSMNYEEIVALEKQDRWSEVGQILANEAKTLEASGAAFILLGCNTLHKVSDQIEAAITVPFLHIADPAGIKISQMGLKKVGLLGTRFTMEEGFYARRLKDKFNLQVITPNESDKAIIDNIIYRELCVGVVKQESKSAMTKMIHDLISNGADSIILACTELGMILDAGNTPKVPVFDTTVLHAQQAVALALSKDSRSFPSLTSKKSKM